MLEGKMFFPLTGTPMRKTDRRMATFRLAPGPLTVATFSVKLLTSTSRRMGPGGFT
jgi:hypothetical protein